MDVGYKNMCWIFVIMLSIVSVVSQQNLIRLASYGPDSFLGISGLAKKHDKENKKDRNAKTTDVWNTGIRSAETKLEDAFPKTTKPRTLNTHQVRVTTGSMTPTVATDLIMHNLTTASVWNNTPKHQMEILNTNQTIRRSSSGNVTQHWNKTNDGNDVWLKLSPEILLNMDGVSTSRTVLGNLSSEPDCANKSCRGSDSQGKYKQRYFRIRSPTLVYISVAVTVFVVVVNCIVLIIFIQKKNRSSLTFLLSCLAITDTLTYLLFSIPEFIVILREKLTYDVHSLLWLPGYTSCTLVLFADALGDTCHQISVTLTAVISVQKSLSMLFPIWSKTRKNNAVSVSIPLVLSFLVLLLYLPNMISIFYSVKGSKDKCLFHETNPLHVIVHSYMSWIFILIYFLCFVIICLSTVIVSCKLTCCRKIFQMVDSSSAQQKYRRSAFLVVLIGIIFMSSEIIKSIYFIHSAMLYFFNVSAYPTPSSFAYDRLSLIIGFSLNFVVYIVMGRRLRETFFTGFRKMCCLF